MKIPVSIKKALRPYKVRLRSYVYCFRGLREYLYDFNKFVEASSTVSKEWTVQRLSAVIVKEYHRIEKGLALPAPRPCFGQSTVRTLFELVPLCEAMFGSIPATLEARSVLHDYRKSPWCEADTGVEIDGFLAGTSLESLPPAGAMLVKRSEIWAASNIDFPQFAANRYSVRDFTGEPVPVEAIRAAVAAAMKSPRVCNRGTTHCYAAFDPEVRALALMLQNGNAGFGHMAGAVLVITASRQGFTDFGERNQCWIDGGLFAMSLNYALHAAGYGTCMLNWSSLSHLDQKLHSLLEIPEDEAVITLMAVGVMKVEFRVAISPREPIEQVFHILDDRLHRVSKAGNHFEAIGY